jgi:hypothetical protein
MPNQHGYPTEIEQYESAARAARQLSEEACSSADFYWTADEGGKRDDITDCLIETPAMIRASGEVYAAYRQLQAAFDSYHSAAKRALDAAQEKGRA